MTRKVVHEKTKDDSQPASRKPYQSDQLQDLTERYKKNPSIELRNKVIIVYESYAIRMAQDLHKKLNLPRAVNVGDLAMEGVLGMLESDTLNKYDPGRGIKFETYAATRTRGAMLDYLRYMDPVEKLTRSRAKITDSIREKHLQEKNRPPSEEETIKDLKQKGLTKKQAERTMKDSKPAKTSSLTPLWEVGEKSWIANNREPASRKHENNYGSPKEESIERDIKDYIKDYITKKLSRAERLVVISYYYEEMTMKEIGKTLGLSESRISQMHSGIIKRLKLHKELEEIAEE